MARNVGGFTLLEALVALAVAAILLAVAIPAWSAASAKAHSAKATGALAESLVDAVRHAGLTGVEVVLCPSTGGGGCTDRSNWTAGWIGFADLDGDRQPGAGDVLIVQKPGLTGGVRLISNQGRPRVVFQPNGGNAGSNVTFTLCDRRGPEHASTLVLSNAGRLRTGTPTPAQAAACMAGT